MLDIFLQTCYSHDIKAKPIMAKRMKICDAKLEGLTRCKRYDSQPPKAFFVVLLFRFYLQLVFPLILPYHLLSAKNMA